MAVRTFGFTSNSRFNIEDRLYAIVRTTEELSKVIQVDISHDLARDIIQLVATTADGRKYMHPLFLDTYEISNSISDEALRDRMISAINGKPSRRPDYPKMKDPEFSLSDIEQAQDFIEQCKS